MHRRRLLTSAVAVFAAPAIARAQTVLKSAKTTYRLVTLTRGLEQPWGMAFLPDGRLLITERPGRLRLFANGQLYPRSLGGLPKIIANGQGGLLDICLHPDFARNQVLYLSYAGPASGASATMVARAELAEGGLRNLTTVFTGTPTSGGLHFGSRIAFDRAGLMYVTAGERYQMKRAQDLKDLAGKVVRLKDDGSIPADNPFIGQPDKQPEIFSWGHRNPQGLAMHPETGRMWLAEHGPKGGDELNLLKAGANYGWPLATHGIDYNGSIITPNKSLPGMEDPVRFWGAVDLAQRALLLYRRPVSSLEGLRLHWRAVELRPVSHRTGWRALAERGAADRRSIALYSRRAPGAGWLYLPHHPYRRRRVVPPRTSVEFHAPAHPRLDQ